MYRPENLEGTAKPSANLGKMNPETALEANLFEKFIPQKLNNSIVVIAKMFTFHN